MPSALAILVAPTALGFHFAHLRGIDRGGPALVDASGPDIARTLSASITRAGIWREVLEFFRLPLPLLRVGRGHFFERNIWPDFRVFRIQRQPFLKPRLGVWLDRVDRAFGLAHPAVDALVRMDNEHVLALIEAVDGAHLDAVHKLTANTAIIDDIGQLGVPPQLKTLTNIEIHRFRPRACPNSSGLCRVQSGQDQCWVGPMWCAPSRAWSAALPRRWRCDASRVSTFAGVQHTVACTRFNG